MSQAAMLGQVISCSEGLMLRLMAGFDDRMAVAQPPGLPNHLIWTLGHCAHTMSRLASMFDGAELPASDFAESAGSQENRAQFDITSICRESTPEDNADRYPTLIRSQEIYAAACHRLANAVAQLDERELNKTVQWHDGPISKVDLIARVCFHNGAHSGQILDLRRALKLPHAIG